MRDNAYSEYKKLLNGMLLRLALFVLLPIGVIFVFSSELGVLIYFGLLGGFVVKALAVRFYRKRTKDFYITLVHSLVLEG